MRATIDIETSYKEEYGRVGNPWGSTCLCSYGMLHGDIYADGYVVTGEPREGQAFKDIKNLPFNMDGVTFLCGHNITFDLLWFWKTPELRAWLKAGGRIWDTAYAEYLLSGQVYHVGHKDPKYNVSLKSTAKRRLGIDDQKLDVVQAMWDKGIPTEDIPEEVLLEYQEQDIRITDKIAVQQMQEAKEKGMVQNILDRMEGLLGTIEMTYNGLYVNQETAEKNRELLVKDIEAFEHRLNDCLTQYNLPEELEFNWGSSAQKSAYIFGGSVKYEVREQKIDEAGDPLYCQKTIKVPVLQDGKQVYYKSGKQVGQPKFRNEIVPDYEKPKMHTVEYFFDLPGVLPDQYKKPSWKTSTGLYSTAESIMEELEKLPVDIPELKLMLDYQGARKDLSTYYYVTQANGKQKGMLTMVSPDGFIHGHLNHSVTVTTRLSSSKPNMQNLSSGEEDEDEGFQGKSRVKELFSSRFGTEGVMIEADYSQLEVVCKAVLSKCPDLARFILEKMDEHCVWAALLNNLTYDEVYQGAKIQGLAKYKHMRQQAKGVTFLEKYGGGAASCSEQTGIPVDVIKAAMERRRMEYPRMYQFDDEVMAEVEASRQLSPFQTALGFSAGIGWYVCVTKTIYSFIEQDAPKWKIDRDKVYTGFKPTTIKNYPSQGLGGLIMQVAIGRIFRWLLQNDFFEEKALMVNTVHDCAWSDCHKDVAGFVAGGIQRIMQDARGYFNKFYKTEWKLPFPAPVNAGPDMLHLGHIEITNELPECVISSYYSPVLYDT